jgi:hypothetical protein
MALWPQFVGPSYRARSASIAADALGNLYTEQTENASEAKQTTYYGTPGCKLQTTVATAVCRGSFAEDGRQWTVIGDQLYPLFTDPVSGAVTAGASLGTISNDGLPVSFASNGRGGEQLVIVGGGQLKVLSLTTNVLTPAIVLPLTNAPIQIDFTDGFFLLVEANTIRVWFSALEDGTLWDALDFFAVSLTSSNVIGIKVMRDRVWVYQSQTAMIYYDSGDADNPFVPYPGSVMQEGAISPWSIIVVGEAIFWAGQDNQGRNRFVMATDYSPVVISTPPISFALASYPTTTDIEVLGYEEEGHPFVIWTCPHGSTWAYDVREKMWHERYGWDPVAGVRTRWRARGSCATDVGIIVGDFANGNIYTLDLDTFTDNGTTIQRLRRAPYLSAENQWLFLDRFELGIQAGVGLSTGQGSAPVLMLSLSRDSGNTWSPPTTASMGAQGEYGARAIWRKLGRARADRLVLEVTQTDPVRAVWGPGAWLKARPGSGQL